MTKRFDATRVLAVSVAAGALLAACNFIPGMGGHNNAANAANVATGPSAVAAGATNSVGLPLGDAGSGMDMAPAANTAMNAVAAPPMPEQASGPLPNMRGGLWSQTSSTAGGAPETQSVCLPGGPIHVDLSAECPLPPPQPGPNGTYVVTSTCQGRLGPVSVRIVGSGDFQNHYTMDSHFELHPTDPSTPARSIDVHMEAVYQGPCPAGVSPGQAQQPQQGGQQGGDDGPK